MFRLGVGSWVICAWVTFVAASVERVSAAFAPVTMTAASCCAPAASVKSLLRTCPTCRTSVCETGLNPMRRAEMV